MRRAFWFALYSTLLLGGILISSPGGPQQPPDHPSVTVKGQTYTPRSILARNMGTEEDQTTQFPPHKIIGNIYYVGTKTLSSFLIVTPQGNILIDSTYERNVPTIEKSVDQLGFKFSDIKILLGNHAHGDHQEGDALVKQMTGAQVMAMAEDVPALQAMKPGGKEHPIDKVLHDGDTVTLGGTTLVAHLTPGHTRGCTTWTTTAQEGGKTYNVMFGCSLRPPAVVTPRDRRGVQSLVQAGAGAALRRAARRSRRPVQHAGEIRQAQRRRPNPFIDPASCTLEADVEEAMFHAILPSSSKPLRSSKSRHSNYRALR